MLPSTVHDFLCDLLSPQDLVRLSQTDKHTLATIKSYYTRAFRIDTLLLPYFTSLETTAFRFWQARTGMLISGSTALQFMNRVSYPDSDLDLYVEHNFALSVAGWLQSIGYVYSPRSLQGSTILSAMDQADESGFRQVECSIQYSPSESLSYFGRGVACVFNFHKEGSNRKIQLITCYHSPIEVILNFHSTCVMNFITHDKAYSLYPRGTFEDRLSLLYSTEGVNQTTAREKYISRGWTLVENDLTVFKPGPRHVGDAQTWTLDLSPKFDIPAEINIAKNLIEGNSWELEYIHYTLADSSEPGEMACEQVEAHMAFFNVSAACLMFEYTVSGDALAAYLEPVLMNPERPRGQTLVDAEVQFLVKCYHHTA